jgi:hypothetical protein
MLLSALSVWDRPAVRGVVLFTAGTIVVAALITCRPSQRYAWLQALLLLGLLSIGIPAAGGVSGITPSGMATLTVLVAWATLFLARVDCGACLECARCSCPTRPGSTLPAN